VGIAFKAFALLAELHAFKHLHLSFQVITFLRKYITLLMEEFILFGDTGNHLQKVFFREGFQCCFHTLKIQLSIRSCNQKSCLCGTELRLVRLPFTTRLPSMSNTRSLHDSSPFLSADVPKVPCSSRL